MSEYLDEMVRQQTPKRKASAVPLDYVPASPEVPPAAFFNNHGMIRVITRDEQELSFPAVELNIVAKEKGADLCTVTLKGGAVYECITPLNDIVKQFHDAQAAQTCSCGADEYE